VRYRPASKLRGLRSNLSRAPLPSWGRATRATPAFFEGHGASGSPNQLGRQETEVRLMAHQGQPPPARPGRSLAEPELQQGSDLPSRLKGRRQLKLRRQARQPGQVGRLARPGRRGC
jgi:hypothetical protein